MSHEQQDLVKFIVNGSECTAPNWHPALDCSGHIYLICPETGLGFERGMMIHNKHVCNISYAGYMSNQKPTVKVQSPKNSIEIEEEQINAIDMVLPEDETNISTTCKCHIEIGRLQERNMKILAELDGLKQWKISLLSATSELVASAELMASIAKKVGSMISHDMTGHPLAQDEALVKDEALAQDEALAKDEASAKNQTLQPAQKTVAKPKSTVKRNSKGHIHASKKEIEKGMWCTTCAACKTVAQYNTDLRACATCNKLTHFNDDLTNCYHWDCVVCQKKSCLACVKQAGGNKIKPFCSASCKSAYNA